MEIKPHFNNFSMASLSAELVKSIVLFNWSKRYAVSSCYSEAASSRKLKIETVVIFHA